MHRITTNLVNFERWLGGGSGWSSRLVWTWPPDCNGAKGERRLAWNKLVRTAELQPSATCVSCPSMAAFSCPARPEVQVPEHPKYQHVTAGQTACADCSSCSNQLVTSVLLSAVFCAMHWNGLKPTIWKKQLVWVVNLSLGQPSTTETN